MSAPAQQDQSVTTSFTNILKRLRLVLPENTSYVRGAVMPNPLQAEYKAEEGIHVLMGSPEPTPDSGAGRWGFKVTRDIVVHVVSRSVLDAVGRDEIALVRHTDLEEAVVNAVLDGHPSVKTREGIQITWVPGGTAVAKASKIDVGFFRSVLVFRLHYAAKLTPGPGPTS